MSLVVSAQSDLLAASELLQYLLCHGFGGSRLGVVNATFSGLRRFAPCKHVSSTLKPWRSTGRPDLSYAILRTSLVERNGQGRLERFWHNHQPRRDGGVHLCCRALSGRMFAKAMHDI
jgi:hypothetical protein